MAAGKTHRSGDVDYDGKVIDIVKGGATSANSTQKLSRWVAPCDGTIENVLVTITTVFTNAAARLRIGPIADTDGLLDDYVLTNVVAGSYDLSRDALMVSRAVTKGTAYVVELTNSDTTGEIDYTVVVVPN